MTDVMAMPLADIDWCEESGVPRSECVQCQTEFQAVAASTPLRESRDRPVARHDACAPGTPSAEPAGHAEPGARQTNPAEMREECHGTNSRARPTAVERERRLEMAADARAEIERGGAS